MGLEGETPEHIDAPSIPTRVSQIKETSNLQLRSQKHIQFIYKKHMVFHFMVNLPQHPNGMRLSCYDAEGDLIATNEFFSIGGGFVVNEHIKVAPKFSKGASTSSSEGASETFSDAASSMGSNDSTSLEGVTAESQSFENVFFKDPRVDHAVSVSNVDTGSLKPENVNLLSQQTKNGTKSKSKQPIPPPPPLDLATVSQTHITAALPFHNAASLLQTCHSKQLSIAQVVFQNELQWRTESEIKRRILNIWNVMDQSIRNGVASTDEYLPGSLKVKRRAPGLYRKLMGGFAQYAGLHDNPKSSATPVSSSSSSSTFSSSNSNTSTASDAQPIKQHYPLHRPSPKDFKRSLPALDWISLYALAVNEENAGGGRVVTAPTNGAAGTIPAVLKYYLEFVCPSPMHVEQDIVEFLLTAAAIGMLYKRGASISAAEMGCQGEVGVACSMAAAGFAAVMGGTVEQVENAAEIGMEHNLGLSCDPPVCVSLSL
jgi:L-serine deaminase